MTLTTTTTVTAAPAPVKTTKVPLTSTPAPTPIKTSGNYGADLAAAGIVPDDVADYGKFMKEYLCDVPLTKDKFWDRSEFSESLRTLSSAASDDVAKVRLSVAYFCPQRTALAEEALKEHGYIK